MTGQMKPKVSIITPLHNKGPYIAETIESVVGQSFVDWEMIVVENGSTDNGPDIVRSIDDPRVRLVVSEKTGPSVARNLGIRESRGEWIQFLDADDLLLAGHLESQWATSQRNPEAGIITCDWLEGVRPEQAQLKHPTNSQRGDGWRASAIAFTPWVVHAACVKRDVLGKPPWWNESMDSMVMEDHVFWFRLLLDVRAVYSPHTGVFYRLDTGQRRHDARDLDKYLGGLESAVARNLDALEHSGRALSYRHRKALMNLYLGLMRFDFSTSGNASRSMVKNGVKRFRPGLSDILTHKDFSSFLAHLLPAAMVHNLQKMRRSAG